MDEALSLLNEMGEVGIPPTAGSYSAAIVACQKAGQRGRSAPLVMERAMLTEAKVVAAGEATAAVESLDLGQELFAGNARENSFFFLSHEPIALNISYSISLLL